MAPHNWEPLSTPHPQQEFQSWPVKNTKQKIYLKMYFLEIFNVFFDWNGYKIYVDIMTAEKLSSIQVPNMDIIYWSVH